MDKEDLPELGATLAVCLEAVGYRLRPGTTVAGLGHDIFGCDRAGLSRRLNGKTGVSAAELSTFVRRLGLDRHGVTPRDLALPPEALRRKLSDRGVGLFGSEPAARLLRHLRAFAGADAGAEIQREKRRAPGFSRARARAREAAGSYILRPREAIRLVFTGPPAARLFVFDLEAEGEETLLITPEVPGSFERPATGGRIGIPAEGGPFIVGEDEQNRLIAALWTEPGFADTLDAGIAPAAETEEFRPVTPASLATLIGALKDSDGPVRAATWLAYRVERGA